jgi:hypothetical protein
LTPIRQGWNRTEQEARGITWPNTYPEDAEKITIADSGGKKNLYYMFQTDMKSPETVQVTFDIQRQVGRLASVSAGYVHTSGKNLPILLNFANAYDRVTGARPRAGFNPGGWYVTSGQTMVYNAFEGNGTLRRYHHLDLAMHYTLSKGWSEQGANLIGNFNSSIGDTTYNNTQDFFDPFLDVDYSPLIGEVRHRVTGTAVYDIPWLADRKDVMGSMLGGWQLASVLNFRSGEPLRITQGSGIANSRPDYNGGNQIFDDWRDTLQYLDRNAYPRVPTSPTTAATIRPGNQNSFRRPRTRAPACGPDGCQAVRAQGHHAAAGSLRVVQRVQLAAVQQPGDQRCRGQFRPDHQRGVDENRSDWTATHLLRVRSWTGDSAFESPVLLPPSHSPYNPSAHQTMSLVPGVRLGAYEIVSLIGSGGMGEVYRARDTRLGRDVAIKVIPPAYSADADRLQRFEQEARAAALLNHPNILAVFDVGTYVSSTGSGPASPYIVSELLEGETLRERLAAGPLPVRKAIDFGIQMAQALAAAHEKGIIHRDLKPENIFINRDGRAKVLDFGLAKLTQPDSPLVAGTNLPTTPPANQTQAVSSSARSATWRPSRCAG